MENKEEVSERKEKEEGERDRSVRREIEEQMERR